MWIIFALLATVFFGARGIMYQWTSQKKIDRNLLLFGVFFVGFIISVLGVTLLNQKWYGWADITVGLALGFGSFAANAFLHKGFSVGKASLISILSGLTPLFVLVFAFLLWQETLTTLQLIGFFIIFGGLYIIRYSNDISFTNLQGAQWGLLAALFFSFNDLLGKQSTLLEADTFATLTSMFGFGSLLFAISWLVSNKKQASDANDSRPNWSPVKTFSCGLLIGLTNVAGMVAIISAFAIGNTGLVSAISGMNILIILLYSRIILKESFTRQELLGLTTAFIGVIVLRLSY
ncbi:DMT family transporter [Pseudoalteromonas sp. SG44-5]|uniref:DMT family transporter n=1 Tax=unclassified Pseudoalteromonas TaxID=194690 RepID=UPI0015F9ED11|nr:MULTISPECIES: DMT family transporter [unclassified Pseudoalteromonas]MBB1407050.1 DMT family transporter [Pseudoalteromonas sp. SG44-5]MBH0091315.1 DMT family transporter [Pseudoalteromonas sp. SCQQ13]